ncbi:hypothetical protein L596_003896 [Steinernema carpocapsae]|uniref:Protein kinase domain-containing protein n=1 Tax=Steinernema carpocapsae TaxID=34508 RepID=A0A4U8UY37_STECR|nr:hypothetical protein L596_003896 [Steinernema carpocapsae]
MTKVCNQGWFISKHRSTKQLEIEDHSDSSTLRRSYEPLRQLEQQCSRRKQLRDSIKNVFNTEESVSGRWRLATLILGILFLAAFGVGIMLYSKAPSMNNGNSQLTNTSTVTLQESAKQPEKNSSRECAGLRNDRAFSSQSTSEASCDHFTFHSKFLQDFDPVKCLGRGGFGIVFECKNKLDECSYAVKRIAVSDNKAAKERVRREVRAMAKLDHPGIIRYYHTWIEHPPKGWQADIDQKILSEMSCFSTSMTENVSESDCRETEEESSVLKHLSFPERARPGDRVDSVKALLARGDSWDVSFAKECTETSEESSSSGCGSEIDDVGYGPTSNTEDSDGIVFGGDPEDEKPPSERFIKRYSCGEGPLGPPVVFVATETSELHTSRAKTNYVYMYIQMELCQRETLHEWLLSNQTRDKQQMCRWFRELVDAVEYVHSQGLIHRDLKPQNIFFAANGRLKVGDLGLATQNLNGDRFVEGDDPAPFSDLCIHTGNVGTRTYMSPEQLLGKPYDSKIDVFALGLIFCEMIKSFVTVMERIEILQGLQKGSVSNILNSLSACDIDFIKWLTKMNPDQRPSCSGIIASEYLNLK